MRIHDLNDTEYHSYYAHYINLASDYNLPNGLDLSGVNTIKFLESINPEKFDYKYAEGKWTIKELLLHIIDTERIFAYRALRIARNDNTPLSGFEQDDYVASSNANTRSTQSLIEEYKSVREATLTLFKSFDNDDLKRLGTASNAPISVRALGFIMIGHEIHHCNIIKERYL